MFDGGNYSWSPTSLHHAPTLQVLASDSGSRFRASACVRVIGNKKRASFEGGNYSWSPTSLLMSPRCRC